MSKGKSRSTQGVKHDGDTRLSRASSAGTEVLERSGSDEASLPWFARARGTAWALLVTGVVAWLASGELVLERLRLYENSEYVTSCDINPWVSCGSVMERWQAALFGFPNPLLGIVGFAIIITIAMALFARARFARWYWWGIQVGVTLAMAFIVWLWSQALFDIAILCIYCMIVWAMMIPMFLLVTFRNIIHGVIPASAGVKQFVGDWAMLMVVLVWLATAASVLIRFFPMFFGSGS